MKRRIFFLFLLVAFTLLSLVSCTREKEFTHCELTMVLDKSFTEEESEEYDLLLTDGEVIISVIRLSFVAALESGIYDTYTAEEFARFFMYQAGKDSDLLIRGGIPYYTYTEEYNGSSFFHTLTFYRSYNAYFIVGYSISGDKSDSHIDRFLEYSEGVYFNDAPSIN